MAKNRSEACLTSEHNRVGTYDIFEFKKTNFVKPSIKIFFKIIYYIYVLQKSTFEKNSFAERNCYW